MTRSPWLLSLLGVVLAALTLVVTPTVAAVAAPTLPRAPVDLFPDGTTTFGQVVASPVTFTAERAADDSAGLGAAVHYVVQQPVGSGWSTVADRTGSTAESIELADGRYRWRARLENRDGAGPWSAWITFTVDSRVPAAPTVTFPGSGGENFPRFTVGKPVSITVSSPDGLASFYYLGDFGPPPSGTGGVDPCDAGQGFVCPATPGGTVVVPWTFLSAGANSLAVWALSRNGRVSDETGPTLVIGTADRDAIPAATRWSVPTTGGSGAVPEAHGGPALYVSPSLKVGTQQVTDGVDIATVPSIAVTTATANTRATSIRTSTTVVDTAHTFSVGAVVARPATLTRELTVFDQPGVGGSAFSLVLTTTAWWMFCVTTADGQQSCAMTSGFGRGDHDSVVGRYDAVRRQISVSTGDSGSQPRGLPGTAALRPAVGGLQFAAAVPGTARYQGLIGSPFVARGWVSGEDLQAFLIPAA